MQTQSLRAKKAAVAPPAALTERPVLLWRLELLLRATAVHHVLVHERGPNEERRAHVSYIHPEARVRRAPAPEQLLLEARQHATALVAVRLEDRRVARPDHVEARQHATANVHERRSRAVPEPPLLVRFAYAWPCPPAPRCSPRRACRSAP